LFIDNLSFLDFTFINDYAMNIFLHITYNFLNEPNWTFDVRIS